MIGKSAQVKKTYTKMDELSSCVISFGKASGEAKEKLVSELKKLKDEMQTERKKRTRKT